MKVGFVGLGNMGSGMAANLLKAGHEVTAYNRTRAKAEALEAKGARVAMEVAGACGGDAVFSMLADDHAVEAVVYGERGILASLAKGSVHISSSTISAALSRRMAEDHHRVGQRYVAAPVFGRPDAAAAAKLFVLAGGHADAVEAVMPLLEAVGQRIFKISDQAEGANLVKLCGNFMIGSVIETVGEAMALAAKGGVDKRVFFEVMTSTLFNAPVYKTYGGLVMDQKFEPPGFAAPLGLKDMKLALSAADELRVPMPVASLLRDRFLALIAQGGDKLDWSAIGGLAAKDAGGNGKAGTPCHEKKGDGSVFEMGDL